MLAAGADGRVRIWDAKTGAIRQTLPDGVAPSKPLRTARFRPGSSAHVVTGDEDGRILVWDRETAGVVAELRSHRGAAMRAAFRPDGLAVVTASTDGAARVDPWFAFVPVDELLERSKLKPALPEPRKAGVFACPPPWQSDPAVPKLIAQ